jgi:acid stress chaperone HdeA
MNKCLAALPFVVTCVASIAASPAFAEKHVAPEKMTCEEFLMLDEEVQPSVVYWLQGRSGEVDVIDIDAYSDPVEYVVAECTKEKKETVGQKIKHWFKTHTKPAPDEM